jgi:hypothetical protein
LSVSPVWFVFSKYENEPELKKKYENSLYIMEILQYPYYKDLIDYAETNPVLIDFPSENISDLMLKVILIVISYILHAV